MRTYQATAILLTIVAMLVASCGPEAEISYKPPLIPIKVSVNSSGEVSVGLSHSLETPIGTFDIGMSTVYKNWDMDLYCNGVKEKDDDGAFTMRYNIERTDGQWYITWKQNVGTF